MAVECDRWNWCRIVSSKDGPKIPTTRHVLLTLALHMNEHGQNAWPSQQTLAVESGLGERTVRQHLGLAESELWIVIYQRRRAQQAWFVHEYVATVPVMLKSLIKPAPWEDDPKGQRPAPAAARSGEHPAAGAERPAANDTTGGSSLQNARRQLPTNSSSNYPMNKSCERVLANTDPAFLNGGKGKEPERRHRPFPDPEPRPEVQQGKLSITDAQLWQIVTDIGPQHDHLVGAMTKILAQRYLDTTEDRLWRVIRAERAKLAQRQQVP